MLQIIDLQRAIAENPNVPAADRKFARERAAALSRLLGLSPRPRKGPKGNA
jgi:hypothetical protein